MKESTFGTRLSFPERPESVASDLIDTMRTAYRIGRDCVWEFPHSPPDPPPNLERRFRTMGRGLRASLQATRAAFHLGASYPSEGTRRNAFDRVAHLATAQQRLTEAFLTMPHTMRQALFDEGHRIGFPDVVLWRTTCSGAMAVARVARVLDAVGMEVWLPTARADTRDKIDLVATFAGTSDVLCLQVKNDHGTAETLCRTFDDDPASADEPYLRDFVRGVREHGQGAAGRYHGLFVRVGSKRTVFHEIESCPDIQRPLLETVMRLIPQVAVRVRARGIRTG